MAETVMEWVDKQKKRKTTSTAQGGNNSSSVPVAKTAYVCKVAKDGWVSILLDGYGTKNFSIYNYTKLTLLGLNDDGTRVRFRVEEGQWKGKKGSMILKGGVDTHISHIPPSTAVPTITVKYGKIDYHWRSNARKDLYGRDIKQQLATLTVNGISVTVTLCSGDQHKPLDEGIYEIAPPDYPHPKRYTEMYTVGGKINQYGLIEGGQLVGCDIVWFPIYPILEERYLHIGHISHGCVTVIDYEKYPEIYDYLIKFRGKGKNGDNIVAFLQVIK